MKISQQSINNAREYLRRLHDEPIESFKNIEFNVVGAGKILIGNYINSECGDAIGFHFSVTWGRYGDAGGVIDKSEAKRLADFIYKKLKINAGR